jgi:hypothetical protein
MDDAFGLHRYASARTANRDDRLDHHRRCANIQSRRDETHSSGAVTGRRTCQYGRRRDRCEKCPTHAIPFESDERCDHHSGLPLARWPRFPSLVGGYIGRPLEACGKIMKIPCFRLAAVSNVRLNSVQLFENAKNEAWNAGES